MIIFNAQTGKTTVEESLEPEIQIVIEPMPTIEERVSTVETVQGEVIRILSEVL